MRGVVRAEMFGQLTSGLEAAWTKLKGEGFLFLFFGFHLVVIFTTCPLFFQVKAGKKKKLLEN